jgi:hypothetical protein
MNSPSLTATGSHVRIAPLDVYLAFNKSPSRLTRQAVCRSPFEKILFLPVRNVAARKVDMTPAP